MMSDDEAVAAEAEAVVDRAARLVDPESHRLYDHYMSSGTRSWRERSIRTDRPSVVAAVELARRRAREVLALALPVPPSRAERELVRDLDALMSSWKGGDTTVLCGRIMTRLERGGRDGDLRVHAFGNRAGTWIEVAVRRRSTAVPRRPSTRSSSRTRTSGTSTTSSRGACG